MIFFPILALISFFANIELGLIILIINWKKALNRIYSLAAFSTAVWCLGSFLEYTSLSPLLNYMGGKVAVFGAILAPVFLLYFFLIFTKNNIVIMKKPVRYLLFVPFLLLAMINFTTDLITSVPVPSSWGYIAKPEILYYPMTVYIMLYTVIGILVCYHFAKKTKSIRERVQAHYIILALCIPLVGGILTDIAFPLLGIINIPLTTTLTTVTAIIIAYTILRHNLMLPLTFSIKTKLTTGILIIIFLFGIVGAFSVTQSREVLKTSIGETASVAAAEAMNKIDRTIYNRIEDWQLFVNESIVISELSRSNQEFTQLGSQEQIHSYIEERDAQWTALAKNDSLPLIDELLNTSLSQKLRKQVTFYNERYDFPLYGEAFFTNKYGAIIGLTGKTSDYDQGDEVWWQQGVIDGVFVSNVTYDTSADIHSLSIVIRIDDYSHQFVGILKVVWNVQEIHNIVRESLIGNSYQKNNTISSLLDFQGRIIYSTGEYTYLEPHPDLLDIIVENVARQRYYFMSDNDDSSRSLVSFALSDGYKLFKGLDLILTYEYDEQWILSPYANLRNTIMLITVLIAFFALIIGLYIANSFAKPIIALRDATVKIGKGQLDTPIAIKASRDEIGALAIALKTMSNQLKTSQTQIMQYSSKLEALLKQKDEFIHQLGHDLKNPLNPVTNLLPLLEKDEQDPERRELFKVVNRNVDYMKNLVIKTIELAKLNSPSLCLHMDDTNISDEVTKVIEKNQLLIKNKRVTVENTIPLHLFVKADKLRLQELITNLLTNAVKYSKEEGRITIDAKEENQFIITAVKDNGMGLTDEQVSRIFEEFYKADPSRHDFESSGLGLAISKRIVEKHGGKIWAESPGLERGTTFYFSLPKGQPQGVCVSEKIMVLTK